ncbi:MAG: alkaline phosphatase family protein [Candidatus Nanohaloarchaea archaeon]
MELLIIGFDGADYELMTSLVDEGKLPNIASLMEEGAYGELESTQIPITPSAWTSFMTGKNPGEHGIFDFTRVTPDGLEVVSFRDVEDDTIFDILSRDHTVGTLNIPATYPPRDVNGFMVGGMMSPSLEKATNDDEVKDILEEEGYSIEVPGTYNGSNEDRLLKQCYETLDARKRSAKRLMDERDLDVFMPVFTVGDRVSHWFWKYHDPDHPDFEESDYREEVEKIYREIDAAVGELLDAAEGDFNVVVMSDHGFTGLYHGFNPNKMLMDSGLLKLRRRPVSLLRYAAFEFGFTLENVYRVVRKLGLENLVKSAADNPDRDWMRKLLSLPFLSFQDVDFERSKAYSALHFGPIFCLEEEAEEEVVALLESLEFEGEKVVSNIVRGNDIFSGRNEEEAPDIVYHTEGMHYQAHRYFEFGSNRVFSEPFNTESGHHRLGGVFVAAGPDVDSRGEIDAARITDVAPTVLTMMGEKVPGDMDGEVLDITDREVSYDETVITDF